MAVVFPDPWRDSTRVSHRPVDVRSALSDRIVGGFWVRSEHIVCYTIWSSASASRMDQTRSGRPRPTSTTAKGVGIARKKREAGHGTAGTL
eukprot:355490-Chlamydomonas_euryale.AAC.4